MTTKNFKPADIDKFVSKLQPLKIIPLGGVGDVTKNMYIYEFGNDIIIVDCGIGFPDEGMPGVDLIIPDITYLQDKQDKIRGYIISHGHDDHIGGLPFIWPKLKAPIYAQKLAGGFIRSKFAESKLPKDAVKVVDINTQLQLGVFKISFYLVSHSVPDSVGIIIETPVGRIIHQSDFKLDWTPVNGQVTDVGKIAVMGEKGVLMMLVDALRSERPGINPSEKTIQPTFEAIESKTAGKILITTASSNMTRIQQAINVAVKSGRKVAFVGRSMDNNSQVSRDLGYLDIPPNLVVDVSEIKRIPDPKLMLLIGGAQGQPESSLSRAANNDHRFVFIKAGDSVVFSADAIPGSESAQNDLIEKLTKLGADVYYSAVNDNLHVSGHASSEEIKTLVALAKPQYLMPIGSTFRGMKAFSEIMQEMGYKKEQILMVEDGRSLEVRPNRVEAGDKVEAKNIYVDGLGVGDISNVILRDRVVMSEEGVVLVVVPMDVQTSRLMGEPDIISRGFVLEQESEELLVKAKNVVKSVVSDHPEGHLDWRFVRKHVEENLDKFFYEETKRNPMILTVIVEV